MSRSEIVSERKNQIIKATIECISRYGYHGFSMRDVAEAAVVSKGIIHYYFLNKEDLMMAVLDNATAEIAASLAASDLGRDVATRLSDVIWICSSIVQNKREYYRINMDFWTQIDQKEKVRQEVSKHYVKFRETIGTIIQQGIEQGVFRQGNALQFASLIIAFIDGIALQWLFDENAFDYDDIVRNCEEAILSFLKA